LRTRELQTLWWDWLSTSERLLRSLHEQTAAVTLRDVERVERIQPELDALMERLKKIDEDAMNCADRIAKDLGVASSVKSIVGCLDKTEGQQLHGLANRVMIVARNLQEVLAKNRKLIENEMTYINGTLTLIAKAAVHVRSPYKKRVASSVLMDKVA
jgi:uncharacterized coiled-coil protein SlyX